MTQMVSADTDRLAHFVIRGERYGHAMQAIYTQLGARRSMVEVELGHQVAVSADRPFAELLVEATSTDLFVDLIHDALMTGGALGMIGTAPTWRVDLALARGHVNPSGRDLTLGRDAESLDAALGQALADGDIPEIRRLRELQAIAAEANGDLGRVEQAAFDGLVADGVPPYAALLLATMTADEVAAQLQADVYAEAGIDPDRWQPAAGVDHNVDTINAVYRYYPELYAIDPTMQWVGLASIAAPQFYAGFLDIRDLRVAAAQGGNVAEVLEATSLPTPLVARLAGLTAEELADGLWMMETTFLDMQKQIFDDMAVQHYAYQVGGLPLIEAFAEGTTPAGKDAERTVSDMLDPWELFAQGRLDESTGLLVDREQRDIIQDEYDDIWNHSLATKLFVTAAGFTAVDPSGGASFFDHMITPDLIDATIDIPDFTGQTPDIPGIETPPVVIGGPGWPSIVWDPPDLPGLPIPDLPGFDTPDIRIDIDGLDPTANVANEEDRMTWIVEVVNAGVLERWHDDPAGLAAQTRLDLLSEVETYRQIPGWARP